MNFHFVSLQVLSIASLRCQGSPDLTSECCFSSVFIPRIVTFVGLSCLAIRETNKSWIFLVFAPYKLHIKKTRRLRFILIIDRMLQPSTQCFSNQCNLTLSSPFQVRCSSFVGSCHPIQAFFFLQFSSRLRLQKK